MKICITGAAGFIGFHLVHKLSKVKNNFIVGIDNMNNYYDVDLKRILNLKKNIPKKNLNFTKPTLLITIVLNLYFLSINLML